MFTVDGVRVELRCEKTGRVATGYSPCRKEIGMRVNAGRWIGLVGTDGEELTLKAEAIIAVAVCDADETRVYLVGGQKILVRDKASEVVGYIDDALL